jgi:FkbM family methyltransferase
VYHILQARTRAHLERNRKQLVVFAFEYIGHEINLEGVYELKELDALCDWLKLCDPEIFNGTAIDIGANIGNHSLYFSDFFNRVYSFEPNPRTYKVLLLNSDLAQNVTCFNVGLSDADSTASITFDASNMGGAQIGTEAPVAGARSVELRTLDAMIDPSERVKLIKIDVEGHEYQALVGAERTIRKNQPIILFEQHLKEFRNGKSPTVELLKSFGYSRFATVRNYPRTRDDFPSFVRYAYGALARLLKGESVEIRLQADVDPGFYFFLVALPHWLDVSAAEGSAA